MSRAYHRRLYGCATLFRVLVLVTALACQVGVGGLVSASSDTPGSPSASLAAASVFCQSGHHTGAPDAPVRHRHVPEQAIVSLVSADSQSAALLAGSPPCPDPVSGSIGKRISLPGARAPPPRYLSASLPRGPPDTV